MTMQLNFVYPFSGTGKGLPWSCTKYSVVCFKVVGIIGGMAKETVKQLSSGESYVIDVVAEDYNTEPPESVKTE